MTVECIFAASTPDEFRSALSAVLEGIEREYGGDQSLLLWRDQSETQEWALLAGRMRKALDTAAVGVGTRHLLHKQQTAAYALQK